MSRAAAATTGRFACAAALLLAGAAAAQSPAPPGKPSGTIRVLEQAIEARAAAVTLPSAGFGTLTVTPCDTCRPVAMLAGSTSVWMLGDRSVSFDELRRALQAAPGSRVVVFYRAPGAELTRFVAQAARTAAP